MGSDPSDENNPRRVYFVDVNGDDELGDGTLEYPFQTIAYALEQAAPATVVDPAAVVVNQGYYSEGLLELPRYVSLESRLGAVVVLEAQINTSEGSSVSWIELRPPANANYLLFIDSFGVTISGVVFQGMSNFLTGAIIVPVGMGISLPEKLDIDIVFENCLFSDLNIGIDIYGNPPVLRRNVFRDIEENAVVIRAEVKMLFAKSLGMHRIRNRLQYF